MPALPRDALILALDQGTHASRALVFDAAGALVAEGAREIGLERPRPDWAEQDGDEIVTSVQSAAEQALAALGPRRAAVAAAGLASQRSNAMCWERESGAPLSPVFSWQDRRAHAWLRQFQAQAEQVHRTTGLFLSPHYGASKLRWSLDNLPAVREALAAGRLAWGPMTSFLTFRLLAERPLLADPQCAARTQLWNLHTGDWDAGLLELFGLPAGHLPRCVPTIHAWGTLPVGDAAVPLVAVNGDQSAALFAFGWPEPDTAYINAGTGAFVQRAVAHTPDYAPRLLTGVVLEDHGPEEGPSRLYTLEGTVNGCASALDWAREELALPHLLERLPGWLAESDAADAAGTTAPPLFLNGISGLGAPFWQADFASRFEGEGDAPRRAVAVVESIAFLLQANQDELAHHVAPPRRIRISGGVSRLDGLCRRLADLSGVPVHRRDDPEGTARGIAYLAAGRPTDWGGDATEDVFPPREGSPQQAALQARYRRWRDILREETGV